MGNLIGKEVIKRKIDEATSNSSLSNLRYVTAMHARPKWNIFKKESLLPPTYSLPLGPVKGCPCGSGGICKQKVTPKGVTLHYPQKKKKKFNILNNAINKPRINAGYNIAAKPQVNPARQQRRRFPTWKMERVSYSPYYGTKIVKAKKFG